MRSSLFSSCGPAKKLASTALLAPGAIVAQRRDHADRVQVGVDLAHEQLALDAVAAGCQARGEVVLHHRHLAVVGVLSMSALPFSMS